MSNIIDKTSIINHTKKGENIKIYKFAEISDSTLEDFVSVGDFAIIRNSVLRERVEIGRQTKVLASSIGLATYTGSFCLISHCVIGKYCAISWDVSIGGANHDIDNLSVTPTYRVFNKNKTDFSSHSNEHLIIGNDVWIAAGAHVLRGITIGDGAVIAANSVVTKDVPPYAIVGGVPAKILKFRFDEITRKRLLELEWWNWPIEKLKKAESLFGCPVDNHILDELEAIKNG